MGLDKVFAKELTKIVKKLALGLGSIVRVFGLGKKTRVSPFERERRSYEQSVREELIKLKEKGLSIPVFTL